MDRNEMLNLLKDEELLPSEICKIKYEMLKEFCIEHHIIGTDNELLSSYDENKTCALCEVYHSCNYCPVYKIGDGCNEDNSTWEKYYCYYHNGDFDEFISRIDSVITMLDRAIEYEKTVSKVLKPDTIVKLQNCMDGTLDEIIDKLLKVYESSRLED